ncbi:hypothetical protein K1X76_00210 [bacterium]|nr:hypothetical protein [bacterium]
MILRVYRHLQEVQQMQNAICDDLKKLNDDLSRLENILDGKPAAPKAPKKVTMPADRVVH